MNKSEKKCKESALKAGYDLVLHKGHFDLVCIKLKDHKEMIIDRVTFVEVKTKNMGLSLEQEIMQKVYSAIEKSNIFISSGVVYPNNADKFFISHFEGNGQINKSITLKLMKELSLEKEIKRFCLENKKIKIVRDAKRDLKWKREMIEREHKQFLDEHPKLLKLREEMKNIYGPYPLSQTRTLLEKLDIKLRYALYRVAKMKDILEEYEPLTDHYRIRPKVLKKLIEEDSLRDNLSTLKEDARIAFNTLFYALESPTALPFIHQNSGFFSWRKSKGGDLSNLVNNRTGYWRESS